MGAFDNLLVTLFKNYADLLKRRFSDDFQEVGNFALFLYLIMCSFLRSFFPLFPFSSSILFADMTTKIVSTDDYMPMPIQTPEEFDKVLNVSWYTPNEPQEQACVFPNRLSPTTRQRILNWLSVFPAFCRFPRCTLYVASISEIFSISSTSLPMTIFQILKSLMRL